MDNQEKLDHVSDLRPDDRGAMYLDKIAHRVVNREVDWFGKNGSIPTTGRNKTSIAVVIGWMDTLFQSIYDKLDIHRGKLDANATKLAAVQSQLVVMQQTLEEIKNRPL